VEVRGRKGEKGRETRGRARLGYFSRGLRVPSYAAASSWLRPSLGAVRTCRTQWGDSLWHSRLSVAASYSCASRRPIRAYVSHTDSAISSERLTTAHGRGWLGSRVVSVMDSGAVRPGFKSQPPEPRRCPVTVFDKLCVHTHRASVNRAAKLVAALLRVARVTAGLAGTGK